jgi:hypothetical protein
MSSIDVTYFLHNLTKNEDGDDTQNIKYIDSDFAASIPTYLGKFNDTVLSNINSIAIKKPNNNLFEMPVIVGNSLSDYKNDANYHIIPIATDIFPSPIDTSFVMQP